jgi:hypothetical protein
LYLFILLLNLTRCSSFSIRGYKRSVIPGVARRKPGINEGIGAAGFRPSLNLCWNAEEKLEHRV